MAQVSQKNNPLQDGVNGQSKDKNSKYESNWGQIIGARRFSNEFSFHIKASRAGKGDKWKNVGEDEDQATDIFVNRLESFLNEKFPTLKFVESKDALNSDKGPCYNLNINRFNEEFN